MRPINRCLNKQLVDLCQQVMKLDNLHSKLNQFLPSHLQPHCHVGSFDKGCLLLIIDATWATELRFSLPALRDTLRKDGCIYQLRSIKIKIMEPQEIKKTQTLSKGQTLSTDARHAIRKTGDRCSYTPLKEALHRFAERSDIKLQQE